MLVEVRILDGELMGLLSKCESWAMSRPPSPVEVDRDNEVAEIVHAARDAGRNVDLSGENLTWVWGIYAELEAADPITPLRAAAHEAHIAACPHC